MTISSTQVDAGSIDTSVEAPAHLKNDKRYADLMKQVSKFGEESSLGKDSLPKLAMAVIRAAADGVIDVETKDSKGKDAAGLIYERYVRSESNKAIHDHTGTKANVSKLRQLIAMGCMTTIDAVEVIQTAFDVRSALVDSDVKVKSAYPYYVDVARAQTKVSAPLTKDELGDIARKEEAKDKDVEGELKRAYKILEALVTGENKAGIKDQDDLTIAAFEAVRERLDKIATLRLRTELEQQAAKLGLKLA